MARRIIWWTLETIKLKKFSLCLRNVKQTVPTKEVLTRLNGIYKVLLNNKKVRETKVTITICNKGWEKLTYLFRSSLYRSKEKVQPWLNIIRSCHTIMTCTLKVKKFKRKQLKIIMKFKIFKVLWVKINWRWRNFTTQ